MTRHRHRPGYTLLEVLLALGISTILMGALYFAISSQLGLASAGRETITGAALARSIVGRMTLDVSAAITLVDPKRYRDANQAALDAETGAATDAATGTTPASGTTGGMTGGMTGMTGGTTGAATGGAATGMTGTDMAAMGSSATGAATQFLPLGVMGDSTTLHLFVSKVPNETYARRDKPAELTSDLRRISYWLSQQGGLCRVEVKLITSQDATTLAVPTSEEANCNIAPEVKSVEFQYFDGTTWLDSWDSLACGADMLTPIGPPRAVAVKLSIQLPNAPEGQLKVIRQVIAVPAANGNNETDTEGGF